MLGSTVLEVAIGLTFCYGTMALIVTTVQEALASLFRLRANTLLAGIKSMLNDPHFEGLARAIYAHPLVNPHTDGTAVDERGLASRPSYIEPAHFAIALVDSLWKAPGDFIQLRSAIEAIPDPQLRAAMLSMVSRAHDLQQFQDMLASWFDNAMARMSGTYKRRQMLISLLLALLLAILFNIDSIHLFRTLWQQPALAAHLKDVSSALDPAVIDALMALPIGWIRFRAAGGGLADHRHDRAVRRAVLVRPDAAGRADARHRRQAGGSAADRAYRGQGRGDAGAAALVSVLAGDGRPPARSTPKRAARAPAIRHPGRTSVLPGSRWDRCGSRRLHSRR
jgi:hypothetical protein